MSLSKKSKFIIGLFLIFGIGAYVGYHFAYATEAAVTDTEVTFEGSVKEFLEKIKENPDSWTQGEKVVSLVGVITGIDKKGITLNQSVYFEFAEGTISTNEFTESQKVQLLGSITSYDTILEELKLNRAAIVKK